MKATGLELRQFYQEWPPGSDRYVEEGEFDDEHGTWLLDDAATYEVGKMGTLGWQGGWHNAPNDARFYTIEYWFRKWKGEKITTPFSVVVPDDEIETFRALCEERNWRIL
jgi:hypothetical protein